MVEQTILNGIAVGELSDCMSSLRQSPDLGKYTFRAKNKWRNGAHCTTEIGDFCACGEQIHRGKTHVIEGDEPAILLGSDQGPNATEALLHALGACLSASFIYHATDQHIHVEQLDIDLEGQLDINGFMGINENVRNGFESICATFTVKANAPREKIEQLCEYAQQRSPVFDMVTNPVPVHIVLASDN
jgi:uncharacterized OsmC-like protein